MKKTKRLLIGLSSLIMGVILVFGVTGVSAAANGNGGQVATDGVITFYEDATVDSSSTTPSRQLPNTNTPTTQKPAGRYPSTGEIVKGAIGFSGVLVVIGACLLYLVKRKRTKEES